MQYPKTFSALFCVIAGVMAAWADQPLLDCHKKSLAAAVANADAGQTINFTGVCSGPVIVGADGLTLNGTGNAVIDGGGRDALTVTGAHQVALSNFEVRNGLDGITGVNGAHITLTNINVHDSILFGISLQTASSAVLSGVSTSHNGIHGLDLETGSAATITGTFNSSQNRVFGINDNGSSLTFSQANVL